MKQIPLLQGKVLLIELPEGVVKVQDSYANGFIYTMDDGYVETWYADEDGDLAGNWRIIGMLSELTESEARQIARHRKHNTIRDGKLAERLMFYNHTTNIYGQATALESLESAILAEGWYFENPYGDEPKPENTPNYAYSVDVRIWESAQSRILDRSRCLLLGREG